MIAISYRREDSLPVAGRLYDRLEQRFGEENVFMDFDSIRPGFDFRDQIKETIEKSKVVVAVIGSRWLGEQTDGSRRIDDPNDFVRLEVAYALQRGIPVIPVLVNNTPIPKAETLPPDIQALTFRHALPLDSGLDFRQHAERLINSISDTTGSPAISPIAGNRRPKFLPVAGVTASLLIDKQGMAEELAVTASDQLEAEMAHVLFTDVVGYSQLASDEQPKLVQQLRHAVRTSTEYNRAHRNKSLICLPTGDGMALVFFEANVRAPLHAAVEISQALRASGNLGVRMGLHTGLVYRVPDINGAQNVSGAGINFAQRVMDCGDAGHILMSQVHASFLCEFDALRPYLHNLGEAEVKHGVRVNLVNYYDGETGNASIPAKLSSSSKMAVPMIDEKSASSCVGAKVVLLYKRSAEPDGTLLQSLKTELTKRGCEVFIDRHLRVGLEWAREIEHAIRSADAVIPLLSPAAVASEMLAFEIEIADDAGQQQQGRPRLLPVRVNWEGPLPDALSTILNPIQYTLWRGPEDTSSVVSELSGAIAEPQRVPIRNTRVLEPPGGAMPLDSRYYIERSTDAEFDKAIARQDSIVLIEGARQMGKTSLLSRGLQRARAAGAKVTCTDLQKLNASDLTSLESFFMTLGTALANQLDLEKFPDEAWRAKSGPNQNFESYIRREVLGNIQKPLIWALDEVDRLFTCAFGSDVFGLFRSWYNARALDPESPWRRLTLAICYATEAHLFITDLNQSPFNVGTRVRLQDFGPTQVQQLNRLYGQPLTHKGEFEAFTKLLGGHPYLVRRGLHEMVARQVSMEELGKLAPLDEGPFADHLKRFLVLISNNEPALQFLTATLKGKPSTDVKLFNRLRAAGLLKGETPADAAFRCELYAQYLGRHLR